MKEIKNCMFQYATRNKVIENTDLITLKEAEVLWDKYQKDIKERWDDFNCPEMCIWIDCLDNTNYHKVEKEIDWRDCELEKGTFYKVVKTKI